MAAGGVSMGRSFTYLFKRRRTLPTIQLLSGGERSADREVRWTVELLLGTMADSSLTDFRSRYLASIKEGLRGLRERHSTLEKVSGLERSYPRLRPLQIYRGEMETIPFSGTLLESAEVTRPAGRYSPSLVPEIFLADGEGFVPRTVVLVGPPGAGKTTTTWKILADWASGELLSDKFDFVLRLTGRGLNALSGEVTMTGLVAAACKLDCSDDVVRALFTDPSRVLILIDGFDELRWTLEDDGEDCEDPFQAASKEAFLRCLLSRDLLAEVSLLLTSSSPSLRKMKDYVQSRSVIELLGFSHQDQEDYFQLYFQDKEQVEQALAVLKENPTLSALCSVPLTCRLVGSIVKAGMKNDLSSANCKTLSTVYLLSLQILLNEIQPLGTCLKKLCALANEGVLNQKYLFEKGDLGRYTLPPAQVASLLRQDVESPTHYSFIHIAIQEFLAAMYYMMVEEAEIHEAGTARGDSDLPRVCKGRSICDQVEEHPHLLSTVPFLFGLLNENRVKNVASAVGSGLSFKAKAALDNWLLAGKPSKFSTAALACFYEAQDEELRARAFHTEDLHLEQCFYSGAMENVPARELLYCTSGRTYCNITLEDFLMRPKDLVLLSPLFHGASKLSFTRCAFAEDTETNGEASWLSNSSSQIKELGFHVCVVAPSFYQDLSALLSSSRSLTKLSISHHILEDSAMKTLCDGLRHKACVLQELVLDDCNLTSSSCQELAAAIEVNHSLQKLDMALNKMEDSGVRFLCEGLKDPGCTLKELRIDFSELSSACCEDLRSLLMVNRSLNTLSFRDHNFQDSGAKLICEGLQHPGCPLKELRLNESNFTSVSCQDFRSVLLTNHTLTTLDLTYNHLEDAGVKVLCEALRDPACTLQELILLHCELGPASCTDIASVLSTNRCLTRLDLTWNNIQDSGATMLCQALRGPSCTLQELRLYGCELTSCEELASTISTNRSLTKLDVSGNQFGDSGIKPLCRALRSPSCTLQEIRVGYCNMTSMCAEEFLAVINTNRCLTEVDVSFSLDEPSADTDSLCQRFQHPACTLERNETQDGTFVCFKYSK